jgi:6-pyruvoyl tetrahydropterin synthase/QueD family protein
VKQLTYYLEKDFTFSAAHHLPQHDGKCRDQHGHNFKGKIVIRSQVLMGGVKDGMVMDYTDVKARIAYTIEKYLDHKDLNVTLPELANLMPGDPKWTGPDLRRLAQTPTSENIATILLHVWRDLAKDKSYGCVYSITIEETDTSRCTVCLED